MAEDPLAEVIRGAGVDRRRSAAAASAVRAHIAAVLAAQEALWRRERVLPDGFEATSNLRAALLGATEETGHQPAQATRERPRTPPGETNQSWEQYQPPIGSPRGFAHG